MQIKSFYFGPLALTIITVFLLTACDSKTPTSENKTDSLIRPAKLLEVGHRKSDDYLSYPAVIKSQQLSVLSFTVSGTLKELLVVEAQKVQQGDILAKLGQQDLQTKLKSARSQFDNANAEYQRAVRLMEGDAISRSDLEQRLSERDVKKAQLESAEKAVQDAVLIAPYAGNIAKISIQTQQAVQAGEPAISILGSGGLEASINLPSSILALAQKEDNSVSSSYLILDVAADRRIPVQFKEASLEADTASQTYEITFTFDAVDGLNIFPGMNATVWFKDPSTLAAGSLEASVPLTALMTDGDQKYVWVVDLQSMVVTRRNVTLEEGVGLELNVSSGLEVGETIVAAGVASLSEGMKIRPWSK
ncbi:MAG: efflux RND transporter periplasmic adaptor subunit [Gammaproteobacteria bacterium]|nr:efflux RND transporter periplasmic adaptor subunit [Gammaproteobacteria bacterium]